MYTKQFYLRVKTNLNFDKLYIETGTSCFHVC